MQVCARALGYSQGPVVLGTVAARPQTLAKCSKGRYIHFTCPSCSSYTTPSTLRDTAIISKMGHRIVVGLPLLRVRRQNPPVRLEPPRATRPRDKATQGVASSWHIWSPIEGTRHLQASYLSPNREVSFTPLRVGWHQAAQVFH
jgi:hypothetical protein